MSRNPFANYPFLLGFEQVERLLERAEKSMTEGFPPFNIEQNGEQSWRITLAVAGFVEQYLSVTVEDRHLIVRGERPQEDAGREYLHRGIALRQFQKSFVLAERLEVAGAALENGLLHIDLIRNDPEPIIQTIKIRS